MSFNPRAAGAAAFAYGVTTFSGLAMPAEALAAAQDYRFEAAGPPAKSGKATIVKIRLVHLPDGFCSLGKAIKTRSLMMWSPL